MDTNSSQPRAIVSAFFCALLAVALIGSSDDGGCGGKPADQLCADTGGTWGPGEFWPTPCGADPLEAKGPAAKAGENVCACPSDKPNWTDGVGCRKCDTPREICQRTGGTWGPGTHWPIACGDDPLDGPGPAAQAGEKVCACPADRPTWSGTEGCRACKSNRQKCSESGGTWGSAAYWPIPCGDDPSLAYGPPSGGKPVCICPSAKPTWNGDTGCSSCPVTAGACRGLSLACWHLEGYEGACWEQKGCYWDTRYIGDCHGGATLCSSIFNAWECTRQRGCGWDPVSAGATRRGICSGVPNFCYQLSGNYDLCWMQRGCHFDYYNNDCQGAVSGCSEMYDQMSCLTQRGCSWRKI